MARPKSDEPKQVTKRGQKVWCVDYVDSSGKRRRLFRDTKAEAKRARDDVVFEMRAGTHAPDARAWTMDGLLDLYVEALRSGTRAKTNRRLRSMTIEDYADQIDRWVRPKVGPWRLSQLDTQAVIRYRDWLVKESGAGQRSREVALAQFKAALREARARGIIVADVWSGISISRDAASGQAEQRVRPSRPAAPEGQESDDEADGDTAPTPDAIPAPDEVRALVKMCWAIASGDFSEIWTIDDEASGCWRRYHASKGPRGWNHMQAGMRRYAPMIEIAALTGVRQSELRGLTVGDVDLKRGDLIVARSIDKKGRVNAVKTSAGSRTIPLAPRAVDVVREVVGDRHRDAWLFPSRADTPIDRGSLTQYGWKSPLKHAGLPSYRFHSLRHHFASQLIAAGADALELKETLGHADIQTTFNIYGHLLRSGEDDRRRRVASIGDALA